MTLFGLVEHGQPLGGLTDMTQWPWTWLRVLSYVRRVRGIYERVAMDPNPKTATPPKWMFWDSDAIDDWFETRKKKADDND